MHLINDLFFLWKLTKHRILPDGGCKLIVADVKMTEYSYELNRELRKFDFLEVQSLDGGFNDYLLSVRNQNPGLSIGDIGTLYLQNRVTDSALVLSEKDYVVMDVAKTENRKWTMLDDYISPIIKDARKLQLYNYLKKVA